MDVRGLRALICLLVVVGCSIAFVSFGVAAGAGWSAAGIDGAALQDEPGEGARLEEADEIHVDVFIHENGSATFTVDHRYAINGDDNESSVDWETLREDVESNSDAYVNAHASDWNQTVTQAENQTERDMNLTNVSVRTDTTTAPRSFGHVQFTFSWESFAHVQLNQIEVGDALSGFTLSDGTTLQFRWPEGYEIYEGPEPSPDAVDNRSVFWNGDETEFTADQPRIVLIENTSEEETPEDDDRPSMPWLPVAAALLLLASVGAAGWWIRGQRVRTDGNAGDGPDAEPAGGASADTPQSNGPPPELLSNEERVLRLLNERGGRIKQQEVVSELDWTEAKTSQVVSRLREDDQIDVFRIGRENVLSLPDDGDDEF